MADDDIFGGDDFFDSNDFDGFDLSDDLEETPDFSDFSGTDLGLTTDDDEILAMEFEEEEPGISRTFKLLIGAGIAIVFIIVIALILFAVLSGDELSAGEKTSTAVAVINDTRATEYSSTLTAIALAENATNTAVAHSEETATAVRIAQVTQEAQMTADAAASATAEAQAAATFAAQTATAETGSLSATQTEAANRRLFGIAVAEGTVPIGNASIQLYRDDGDGVFTGGETPIPTSPPVSSGDTGDTGSTGGDAGSDTGSDLGGGDSDAGMAVQSISYGELATGNLAAGETATWTFTGNSGDALIINAIASSPAMDLFLRVYDPDGAMLAEDDNGSGGNDPMLTNLALPVNGQYTLEVSSITGGGAYTLSLSLGLSSPGTDVEDLEPTPEEIGANINTSKDGLILFAKAEVPADNSVMRRQDPTATPALSQDQLIDIVTTGTNGEFDFGSLEPGIYWLVIDYNSLSAELQALIPPTAQLVFRVDVPVGGEFTIDVFQPTATPTPEGAVSEFDQTATAFATRNTVSTQPPITPGEGELVTLTPSAEAGTIAVTMPDTGIFDEIGGGDNDLDGTGGLTVLAIAAAGLVAVVFIARKLRSAN